MPPLAPFPWIDVVIILALVVINGLFAMSELAIVSSRGARLEAMARTGRGGARIAIRLRDNPGKFLSTVQIGITLIAILAGAFSGEALGGPVAARLERLGIDHGHADHLGFALVIVVTTYVSLIVGELVPKQIALRNPEPIAAILRDHLAPSEFQSALRVSRDETEGYLLLEGDWNGRTVVGAEIFGPFDTPGAARSWVEARAERWVRGGRAVPDRKD